MLFAPAVKGLPLLLVLLLGASAGGTPPALSPLERRDMLGEPCYRLDVN